MKPVCCSHDLAAAGLFMRYNHSTRDPITYFLPGTSRLGRRRTRARPVAAVSRAEWRGYDQVGIVNRIARDAYAARRSCGVLPRSDG